MTAGVQTHPKLIGGHRVGVASGRELGGGGQARGEPAMDGELAKGMFYRPTVFQRAQIDNR